jgi:hypothetical protein
VQNKSVPNLTTTVLGVNEVKFYGSALIGKPLPIIVNLVPSIDPVSGKISVTFKTFVISI